MDWSKFGKTIREAREERGLYQKYVAKRIGTTSQHLSKCEKGEKGLNAEKLVRICLLLGITDLEQFLTSNN